MAKAKKIVRTKRVPSANIELNRWCIEMAMRWPVVSTGTYGAQGGTYLPHSQVDADVIARANKIMAWVTAQH